jgi:hypothetical protein
VTHFERAIIGLPVVAIITGMALIIYPDGNRRSTAAVPKSTETPSGTEARSSPEGRDDSPLSECASWTTDAASVDDPPRGSGPKALVRVVARRVEKLRGLSFDRHVTKQLLPPDEATRSLAKIVGRRAPGDRAERALKALALLDWRVDLQRLSTEFVARQIFGIYLPARNKLVVKSASDSLSPLGETILAHELAHALTDQVLGLPKLGRFRPRARDAGIAARALAEGDATLLEQRYSLNALTFAEQMQMDDDPVLDDMKRDSGRVPVIFELQGSFPYTEGLTFVCSLYRRGGWTAVNLAYSSPPSTTAQVMWPHRYWTRDKPVDPPDQRLGSSGWTGGSVMSFGAADLMWLFSAPGGDTDLALESPRAAARSWAGGEMRVWTRGQATALGLALVDRRAYLDLCTSMFRWYESARPNVRIYPSGPTPSRGYESSKRSAFVHCKGRHVRVGIAPTMVMARSIAQGGVWP